MFQNMDGFPYECMLWLLSHPVMSDSLQPMDSWYFIGFLVTVTGFSLFFFSTLTSLWFPLLVLPQNVNVSFSSVQFSRSVVSDSLRPHEPQHARPPCPSPTPGVYSYSCPSTDIHRLMPSSHLILCGRLLLIHLL